MKNGHAHRDAAVHNDSAAQLKQYVLGFVLSVALTLGSFGVVMRASELGLSKGAVLGAIVILGVLQLVVQLVYFLHLGTASSKRTNTGIFICTAALIVIIVGLSLWVIHNANTNMMPTHMTIERAIARD